MKNITRLKRLFNHNTVKLFKLFWFGRKVYINLQSTCNKTLTFPKAPLIYESKLYEVFKLAQNPVIYTTLKHSSTPEV